MPVSENPTSPEKRTKFRTILEKIAFAKETTEDEINFLMTCAIENYKYQELFYEFFDQFYEDSITQKRLSLILDEIDEKMKATDNAEFLKNIDFKSLTINQLTLHAIARGAELSEKQIDDFSTRFLQNPNLMFAFAFAIDESGEDSPEGKRLLYLLTQIHSRIEFLRFKESLKKTTSQSIKN